jgi:hypothetical protein
VGVCPISKCPKDYPHASADIQEGLKSISILRDTSPYQFPDKGAGQGFIRLKADRALAGLETLKFVLMVCDYGRTHGIKGTMACAGTEAHKYSSVKSESGDLITNALFGFRGCGFNNLPKPLKGGAFFIAQ